MNRQAEPLGIRERRGFSAPHALSVARETLSQVARSGAYDVIPAPTEERIGGIRCLRFKPQCAAKGTVLHFHGGGFRLGCPEMVSRFATALAVRCSVEVLTPAYRLAPEHPFPAALLDGWNVISELDLATGPVVLSGDSAGGGLAASLTAVACSRQFPLAGLCLVSPWLDLTLGNDSYASNARRDPVFSREAATDAARLYLQDWPATDPLASPRFARLSEFPPTLIVVGSDEVLVDDSRSFRDALETSGVRSELLVVPGMQHAAITRDLALPGAERGLCSLVDFIDRQLQRFANER